MAGNTQVPSSQEPDNSPDFKQPQRMQFGAAPQPKAKAVPIGRVEHMGPISRVVISTSGDDPSTREEKPSHPSMREPNIKSRLQFLPDGTSVYSEERTDAQPASPSDGIPNLLRTPDGRTISDYAALSAANGMTPIMVGSKVMSLIEAEIKGVLVRDERGQLRLATTSTVVAQPQPAQQIGNALPDQQQPAEVPLPVEAHNTMDNIFTKLGKDEGVFFGYMETALTEGSDRVANEVASRLGVEPAVAKKQIDSLVRTFNGQTWVHVGFTSPEEATAFDAYLKRPEILASAQAARRAMVGRGDFTIAKTLLAAARNTGELHSDQQLAEAVTGAGLRTWFDGETLMVSLNGRPTRLRSALKAGLITISPNRA